MMRRRYRESAPKCSKHAVPLDIMQRIGAAFHTPRSLLRHVDCDTLATKDKVVRMRQYSPSIAQEQDDERLVLVRAGQIALEGTLNVPSNAAAIVLFAHGRGSSRYSRRNRFIAAQLRAAGFATLLFDLLTAAEEAIAVRTRRVRVDIGLLARRLIGATDWLAQQPSLCDLRIGYAGASTGTAAALIAAAERPDTIRAVVSRSGRPDLAGRALPHVRAPTLLIVGGNDAPAIELNRTAFGQLRVEKQLAVIAGATHLFEESGALEQVAALARRWFDRHL
jgi:putative phosphoribosyl transferase